MDEGPTKNSEPMFIQMPCIALVHSYVCLGCVCVWVGGWMDWWVGGMGTGEGDLRPPSPVICKSHEL